MFGLVGSMASICSLSFSMIGVIISFISLNLLGVWLGLELSFLSVICFASGSSVEEAESVMKYFIIQVLGSCVCGMGFLLSINMVEIMFSQVFIFIGLMMKLGIFPFHFWVSPVVSKLSWAGCASVLLLQKLIPLWIFSNYLFLYKDVSRAEFLCCLTSLVGCLGGLGVLNYRVLLGFSSIQNLGPMMLLCCCSDFYLWVYVVVYMMISGFLMLSLWSLGVYCFQDLIKDKDYFGMSKLWWVSLYFFSSAGLPPFMGSAMKISLLLGCWNLMPLGSGICIFSSCVSLFFYLSVVLALVVSWGKTLFLFNKSNLQPLNRINSFSLLVNVAGGFLLFLCLSL
uniref:NADH dehydrogenase subunit 2 n=1 Tax=Tapes conspersus TaxID=2784307 RepID=UPI002239130B|nr:NADH dehydrogenase subunit 2 [Tapes conspersus]UYR95123.1 NADH dehydrogenase subunit 2 [Tapes conspersus]